MLLATIGLAVVSSGRADDVGNGASVSEPPSVAAVEHAAEPTHAGGSMLAIRPEGMVYPVDHDGESGGWEPADEGILRRLRAITPIEGVVDLDGAVQVESMPLTFYPGARLVRVRQQWKPPVLALYFLDDGESVLQLDGKSRAIHAFNAKHPPTFSVDRVAGYLWFFGFFVRGEEGPFLIVGTGNDDLLPLDAADVRRAIEATARAPRCAGADGGAFVCDTVLYYGNALFNAQFKVTRRGMVEMLEDEQVAADLSEAIDAPISIREAGERFSVEPVPVTPKTRAWRF